MTRYIFVTGGVVSSLGKGLAAAALGALLQAYGYKVRLRKFDPYLNVDPGTMSPFQHGEVYVTDDGAETDLDLGHYERFTGVSGKRSDSITSGKVYSHVIAKERRGDYLGATVQVIPHITDAIKEFVTKDQEPDLDFMICEVGGTVGDIESLPFIEAFRQFANDVGYTNALFIHLTFVPYIPSAGELKTKPSQHSVKELLSMGIQPDILLCRSDRPIPEDARQKLALFCNIKPEFVIEALDVDTIYQVPLSYAKAGLDLQVLNYFGMKHENPADLSRWEEIVKHIRSPDKEVNIAVVGKYTALKDAYKSLSEALVHGGFPYNARVNIHWMDAEDFEKSHEGRICSASPDVVSEKLKGMDGILVPGGYGERGTQGMIAAIEYARTRHVPYFGICLGMQLAIIEFARHVLHLQDATSTEFHETSYPVVGLLTEWVQGETVHKRSARDDLGGTMRLGAYPCRLKSGTLAEKVFQRPEIFERHRHRYEVNIGYRPQLEAAGMIFSGLSPDGILPEMIEIQDHPWFLAGQFHPELRSRPFEPHPMFSAFIKAALDYAQKHPFPQS